MSNLDLIEKKLKDFSTNLFLALGCKNPSDENKFNVALAITLVMLGNLNRNQGPQIYKKLIDEITYSSQEFVKNLMLDPSEIVLDDFELEEIHRFLKINSPSSSKLATRINGFIGFKVLFDLRAKIIIDKVRNNDDPSYISLSVFTYLSKLESDSVIPNPGSILGLLFDLYSSLIKLK